MSTVDDFLPLQPSVDNLKQIIANLSRCFETFPTNDNCITFSALVREASQILHVLYDKTKAAYNLVKRIEAMAEKFELEQNASLDVMREKKRDMEGFATATGALA